MRQAEKDALAQIAENLENGVLQPLHMLAKGEIPAFEIPTEEAEAPAAPRREAKAPEGEPLLVWVEKEKGFGCVECEEIFKTGPAALHAFEEHNVPLAELQAEGITHGRKWQMKKYLEKHAPEALKGYGRGKAKPQPEE